jgi:7-carboxy-7-deazaguanine synthase
MDPLRIAEVFASIQGESTHAGRLCVFVRLSGCNLRCRWCDTAWAWNEGEDRDVEDVLREVREFGLPLVEVTGGEPLAQVAMPRLVEGLLEEGFEVLVETNGSLDIRVLPSGARCILDLKPPSSGECERILWSNLDHLRNDDEVKIVIASREDFDWARRVLQEGRIPAGGTVLLSPLADALAPATLAVWILEARLAVRLQLQLHKLLWPTETRGR